MQRIFTLLFLSIPTFGFSQISTFPYFEDFESGPGGWSSATLVGGDSWNLGTPDGTVINQAAPGGTMSWYVDTLNTGINEQSNVFSPVFDFSNVPYPSVELDIWWDLVYDSDGAVFQSSIDGGSSWQNVGHHDDDPNLWPNWYNHGFLSMGFPVGGAGSQNISNWTGDDTLGTQGWVTAKRALDGLGGEPSVMLRMAWINKTNNLSHPANGIAFDNIRITNLPAVDLAITDVSQAGPCGGGYPGQAVVTISNFGAESTTIDLLQDSAGTGFPIPSTTVPGFGSVQVIAELPLQNPGDTALPVGVVHPSDENPNNNFLLGTFDCNVINALGHCNDFETTANGPWFPDPEGTNSSWGLGPNSTNQTINSPFSGSNFWGTTGPDGGYNPNEQSALVSPFFDFTGTQNSGVSFQLWHDLETNYDGGVFQFSTDGGGTWTTLGAQGTGTNWFNFGAVDGGGSGGQNTANWNGASGGWVNSAHPSPGLDGQQNVLFRLALGADDIFQDGGMGLDNFCITGEEQQLPNVVINELDVLDPSGQVFIVELYNLESVSVDLTGYQLKSADNLVSYIVPISGTIDPLGYRVFDLSNDIDLSIVHHQTLTLENGQGGILDRLTTANPPVGLPTSDGHFSEPDTFILKTISRIPNGLDTDNNATDFSFACRTLGIENLSDPSSCEPQQNSMVINEIHGDTIEIFNKTNNLYDLSGVAILVSDGVISVGFNFSGTIAPMGYSTIEVSGIQGSDIYDHEIQLVHNNTVLDNLCYGFNFVGTGADCVEGSFDPEESSEGAPSCSASRVPNGHDTGNNSNDFQIVGATIGLPNSSEACMVTSVSEPERSTRLKVWPNPATDHISFNVEGQRTLRLQVVNNFGSTVMEVANMTHRNLDVSHLPNGVYSMVATDTNGNASVARFVKH